MGDQLSVILSPQKGLSILMGRHTYALPYRLLELEPWKPSGTPRGLGWASLPSQQSHYKADSVQWPVSGPFICSPQ